MRNHKKLKTFARKMRTPKEIIKRISIFQTDAWENRVVAKSNKKNNKKKSK